MVSKICFLVDASKSMSNKFQGNDKLNKFQAVSKAFAEAFTKPINRGKELKLELFTYKTSGAFHQEVDCSRIGLFPSAYSFNALSQLKPDGNSPLLEAIIKVAELMGKIGTDKKAIAIISGDCESNYKLKMDDIDSKILPLLVESKISVSILQAGSSEEQLYSPLNKALQSVIIKQPLMESKLAIGESQIKNWIRAFVDKY
jgi:hypothetical protein